MKSSGPRTNSSTSLWRVDVASQRGATDAISESVENSPSEASFDKERRIALGLLGFDPDTANVTGHNYDRDLIDMYRRLLTHRRPTALAMTCCEVPVQRA